MTDLGRLDATAQAELVRSGEASPAELVAAAIERIERVDPQLNAVIHRRFERAREEARAELPTGPFCGVPFLVKDAVCQTEGDPYHLGMRFLAERGHTADHDSWLATRYRRAGFVLLGKTNLPELALSATTEPEAYGPTANPWDPTRTPGGSSGGSGAAVAAGMVPVAHGNDMGGSIRIPSACCGLVGLKPSRARTTVGPDFGEYWGQMTHEHVLTRSVRDSAAVLDAVAGPGCGDPYRAPPPARPWLQEVGADPGRLRVGYLAARPDGGSADPECRAAAERTAALLADLGHEVEPGGPDGLDDGDIGWAYFTMLGTHVASELDRIGALVGATITADDVEARTWEIAEMGRSVGAVQLVESTHAMHRWSRRVAAWWEVAGHDVLVTPQIPIVTPRLGRMDDAALGAVVGFTVPFNITGQPAISLPLHTTASGLPVGVQLVAAYGREDLLLRVAAQLEAADPWNDRRPPIHA